MCNENYKTSWGEMKGYLNRDILFSCIGIFNIAKMYIFPPWSLDTTQSPVKKPAGFLHYTLYYTYTHIHYTFTFYIINFYINNINFFSWQVDSITHLEMQKAIWQPIWLWNVEDLYYLTSKFSIWL